MKPKIKEWLDIVVDGKWKENHDGTINVKGSVVLGYDVVTIPVQFDFVSEYFIGGPSLDSLEGSPIIVNELFDVSTSGISSLEGAPEWVGQGFDCSHSDITSLKGVPTRVGGDFRCRNTKITNIWKLRYIFLCELHGNFISTFSPEVNDIINTYKYNGVDKTSVPKGLQALKKYIEENK